MRVSEIKATNSPDALASNPKPAEATAWESGGHPSGERDWNPAGHPFAPALELKPTEPSPLISAPCTQVQLTSRNFVWWRESLRIRQLRFHRKDWEWAFICQALYERNCLQQGKRGLGFAVGREPLPSLFASLGCRILATDMPADDAQKAGWTQSRQHCEELDSLNRRGICNPAAFAERVEFRHVDMRHLPDDLRQYDFLWSSCSIEHLGSLGAGLDFVKKSLACLKPGGVAIHTTEYNCDSNDATLDSGPVILYRRRDFEALAKELRGQGHGITLGFELGNEIADKHIQSKPYTNDVHLKLLLSGFVATSYGLIVQKGRDSFSG